MKIEEKIKSFDKNIKDLEIERNNELYEAIKEINYKYSKQINEIEKEKQKIRNLAYLDYDDSIEAIRYLVSKIEEKDYEKVIISIKYNDKYSDKAVVSGETRDFKVLGITSDKENVEIKRNKIYNISDLNKQYDNFIMLALFNRKIGLLLNAKNLSINHYNRINFLSEMYNAHSGVYAAVDSYICDERYQYIIDYIKEIVDYRVEKENNEINLDEMKQIADEFVKETKNVKKLVKNIK